MATHAHTLDAEKIDIIRMLTAIDNPSALKEMRHVLLKWLPDSQRPEKTPEEIEFPFLQFTPEELEQEVLQAEASGKGIPHDEVWAKLQQKYPWLCK